MSLTAGDQRTSEIVAEDIHDVLRNRRRRLVIDILQDNGGPQTVRELSEHIGAVESGEEPPPRNVKQSVYVSLLQTHLPKLHELGVVDYQPEGKTVGVAEGFEDVEVFLETVPKYGITKSEYYTGLSILGLLTVLGAEIGTPVLSQIPGVIWAYAVFLVILCSGLFHTYTQGRSILHRL